MTYTRGGSSEWSIVTVTHNSAAHLRRYWPEAEIGAAEWIVVDNASQDDSVGIARALGARVVELSENEGFSRANNVGIRLGERSYVAFVNPDVTIPNPDDFQRLALVIQANDALVAPQLANPGGTDQLNGRGLPFPLHKLAHRSFRVPGVLLGDYARAGFVAPTYVAWAMGAAIAGTRQLFRELGGWDEHYFIYYEDHDLGLRSWLSGHPVVLDPGVRWVHEWQRATTRFDFAPWRHELRSARIFYSQYPNLLRPRKAAADPRLAVVRNHLWRSAVDP